MIELELTEGLVMEDTDAALRCLSRLKDIGLRISIDDFGTGHSCLSYLRRFPIDILKIDKSFVAEIGSSDDSGIIIEAIISLARSLKIDTVAEGVETPEQLEFLIDRGCHVAQGFLFGLPMTDADVIPLLDDLGDETGLQADVPMPLAGAAGE
jgi:EAL domain-containing protein (putative c-di-GMP-specific phosphodiesterase class I)